jgi:hypothetical protein
LFAAGSQPDSCCAGSSFSKKITTLHIVSSKVIGNVKPYGCPIVPQDFFSG